MSVFFSYGLYTVLEYCSEESDTGAGFSLGLYILKKMLKIGSEAEKTRKNNLSSVERCTPVTYSDRFICQKEHLQAV